MLKKYRSTALDGEDVSILADGMANKRKVGERCILQRHDQVIAKQQSAIAELRQTVAKLEESTASSAIPNFALNRITNLKKAKEEMEAKITAEIAAARERIANLTDEKLYDEVCRLTDLLNSAETELAVGKETRRDIAEALHSSEELYFRCVRRLNDELGIKEVLGRKPLADNDKRDDVIKQRHKGMEVIANHVKSLKARIQRQQDLLSSYDDDMKRLEDTESRLSKQSCHVKYLEEELNEKKDEISYLQEALRKSRHECDTLRRLDNSRKEKKQLAMDYAKR